MADFAALEDQDGIRLSWNIWPNSRIEATKAVIPFASIYTPNKRLQHLQVPCALPASIELFPLLHCRCGSTWQSKMPDAASGSACMHHALSCMCVLVRAHLWEPSLLLHAGGPLRARAMQDLRRRPQLLRYRGL